MANPVKPSEICETVPSPTASICDKLKKFFNLPKLLCEFWEWAWDTNGNPTSAFKASFISLGMPVGGVIWYPLNSTPEGYLIANGQAVNRTTYASLHAVYGTKFGAGDGSTTFNLPNLQGKFLLGASGTHVVGDPGGAESTSFTIQGNQLPKHNHALGVSGSGTNIDSQAGEFDASSGAINYSTANQNTVGYTRDQDYSGTQEAVTVQTMPPFQVGLWLIKT